MKYESAGTSIDILRKPRAKAVVEKNLGPEDEIEFVSRTETVTHWSLFRTDCLLRSSVRTPPAPTSAIGPPHTVTRTSQASR